MHRLLAVIILSVTSMGAVSQELPAATEFWYCAHLYRWAQTQAKDQTNLMNHIKASAALFEAGATILSNGVPVKSEYEAADREFSGALKKAAEENKKGPDFFKAIDAECYEKQRRHAMAMLKKSGEVGNAQEPYFTHQLTHGGVSAEAIAKHQEFIRSGPGVAIDDGKDSIAYSFVRQIGEARDIAHHVFTKEGHPAHPGVVFLLSSRDSVSARPKITHRASNAGPKQEFISYYTAVVLMNQGR